MMIIRKCLLVCLALFMAACASVENVPNNFNLSPQSNNGILLASVTYHGTYSGYSILFRKVGATDFQKLTIGTGTALVPPGLLDWDIKQRGLRGNLFAVELPAGDYEFYSWRVASGYANVKPSSDFRIPFSIIPGKATYQGNFKFNRDTGVGLTVIAVDVQYHDEATRDISIFQKKYAAIDPSNVKLGIDPSALAHRLGGSSSATIHIPIIVPVR